MQFRVSRILKLVLNEIRSKILHDRFDLKYSLWIWIWNIIVDRTIDKKEDRLVIIDVPFIITFDLKFEVSVS